jgi:small subunit ribosomal protein S1
MLVPNPKHPGEDLAPHDEGWWESVLSDEVRFATTTSTNPPQHSSGRENSTRFRQRRESQSSGLPSQRNTPTDLGRAGTMYRQDVVVSAPRPSSREGSPKSQPKGQSKSMPQPEPIATLSEADWAYVIDVYKQDQILTLTVTNYNRGGLLVEAQRLEGFVPYSHLVEMTCQGDLEREAFLSEYVGRDLRLKIIECAPDEGRIIFSERAARADAGRRTQLFSSLRIGDIATGEVTNITDFGVFVDLGGVEGLIHISELSWGRVIHPSNILQLRQSVEVQVLDILPERCRIALSLKRLKPNPWESIAGCYAVNDVVPATITSVASFGVFARLEEGLEGLVHISEMEPSDLSIKDAFTEGQQVKVRILQVDPQHQRLGLSLKLNGN